MIAPVTVVMLLAVDRRTDIGHRWEALAAQAPAIEVTSLEKANDVATRVDVRVAGDDPARAVENTVAALRAAGILVTAIREVGCVRPDGTGYRPLDTVLRESRQWMADQEDAERARRRRRLAEEPDPTPSSPAEPDTLARWLAIGKADTWTSRAADPDLTTSSFIHCGTLSELADRIGEGNWGLGSAFYYHDLCLIQRQDSGDEWLAIRYGHPFETITTHGLIVRGVFGPFVRRLLAATEEQILTGSY